MAKKDVLLGPKTPNWASRIVCRCGNPCSAKVRAAALAADKTRDKQPKTVAANPPRGAWSDETKFLRSQLEEQKRQLAKLKQEKKRWDVERVATKQKESDDEEGEEESIEDMVKAKDQLARVLPESPEVKSLEARIEDAKRKRDQGKPLRTQTLVAERTLEKKRRQFEAAKKTFSDLQEKLKLSEEDLETTRAAVMAAEADVNALHKRALAELNGGIPAATVQCKEAYDRVIGSLPEHMVQAAQNQQVLEQLKAVLAKVFEAAKQNDTMREGDGANASPTSPAPSPAPDEEVSMDAEDQSEFNSLYDAIVASAAAGDDSDGSGSRQPLVKRLGKMSEALTAKRSKVSFDCG